VGRGHVSLLTSYWDAYFVTLEVMTTFYPMFRKYFTTDRAAVGVEHRRRLRHPQRADDDARERVLRLGLRVGFGRIVVSEIEVPNMLVNLV
jgi:hypothetical protein